MKFNRLRLSGFKSFVDPTELYIEPGITAIVGPNGCGKSNLVEALRWVMGENSPKSMRSSGMEDVIFSGSANRPERNFAEVTVLLDNADRKAPSQFNDDSELEVSRRIEREAGSAYRVNGREVRQRDVQLLFADAATGAHAPSLVSQGRVGALINAKPRERRAILEEAAGIMGLHSRRHEAELRLRAAENNLTRLEDVMGQLESQYKALKRQARQAGRYKTLSARTRKTEATLLYLRWRAADEAVAKAGTGLEEAEAAVRDRTAEEAGASARQADLTAKLQPARDSEAEAAARLHRLTMERDHLDAEEARAREAALRLKQRIEQIAEDKQREQTLIEDARAALSRLEEEEAELLAAGEAQGEAEAEAQAAAEAAGAAAAEAEERFDDKTQHHAAELARRRALEKDQERAAQRKAHLRAEHEKTRSAISALSAELDDSGSGKEKGEDIATIRAEADALREAATEAESARETAAAAEAEAREDREAYETKLTRIEAEIEALRQLVQSEADDGRPVLEDLSVSAGYEKALGAALGDDLAASLDETDDIRWRVMDPLKDAPPLPAGVTPLAANVRAPQALARRLTQIGVVPENEGDTLQPGLKAGQRLVSRQGSLWRWDGYTVRAGARDAAAARLEQRNRLIALEEDLEGLREQTEAARERYAAARRELEQRDEAEKRTRREWRETQERLDSVRARQAEAAQKQAESTRRLNELEGAARRLENEIAEVEAQQEQMRADFEKLEDIDALSRAVEENRDEVRTARETLSQARAQLDSLMREVETRRRRREAIEAEKKGWRDRISGAEAQLANLEKRAAETGAELADIEGRPKLLAEQRNNLLDRVGEAETARKSAADALAELENQVREADRALRASQQALSEAREHRVRAEAAKESAEERREAVVARMKESFDGGPDLALEYAEIDIPKDGSEPDLPDPEKVEAQLERLRQERDRMGPVNLRAEEEAEELSEQVAAMKSEHEDLEGAIARLRQGINSLNREGRERLLAAFEQVNGHFAELFTELFGGGRAYLTLTESDDPLEAGLEIMAQPPGKKLQIMSLLSGGEQALTALSLIFAVFLTNPSPICVLDEVDAPLDDANVERLCHLIRQIADQTHTRFLIVTHNPITMANVDRLFGVTMGERGVSQLVSVDLDRAERLRAVG